MNHFAKSWVWLRSQLKSRTLKQEIDEELRFHIEQQTKENLTAGMSPQDAGRKARIFSLAFLGGIGGLAFAAAGLKLLAMLIPPYLPRLNSPHLDLHALGFTAFLCLTTGLLCGCVPACQAGRIKLGAALKQAGFSATASLGRKRIRGALVSAEFALTVVLLAGAGLMIESVVRLLNVNPGFDSANLLRIDLELPWDKYNDSEHDTRASQLRQVLYEKLHEGLAGLPGVSAVGVGKHSAWPERLTQTGGQQPMEVLMEGCGVGSNDLFQAMRIPLRQGRYLDQRDIGQSSAVLVNEAMARMFWPNASALGQKFGGQTAYGDREYEVVGVVGDVRDASFKQQLRPCFYRPCFELRLEGFKPFFVVRCEKAPLNLVSLIRQELKAAEPSMRTPQITLSQEVLYSSTQAQRTYMLFLTAFAGTGLLLACIGIYGVLAYSVARRTRELGIRIALGAQRGGILGLVLTEGARLVAVGIVLGLIASFWLTRLLGDQLFQVSPNDPLVLGAVVLLLTAVGALACLPPALRATRVNPMAALRYE